MLRFFLPVALALISVNAIAQSTDQSPLKFDVIPPAPEAASIGKFVDQPVGAYTGVPKIDIPIYTLKSYELSLPISLSYHASGIKWEEIPSWVGAGWTLNAGGIVSRTIRGRNDEDPLYGYFMTGAAAGHDIPSFFSGSTFNTAIFYDMTTNCSPDEATDAYRDVLYASRGGLDLEPDQFFFSLPDGQSGKFIFSRSQQMRLFPHQFATITHSTNFGTWMITGKDGTKYFFEKRETSTNSSPCKTLPGADDQIFENEVVPDVDAVSSWKLVRMENASGSDYINFTYVAETYTYRTRMSTTSYDVLTRYGPIQLPGSSYCWNNTTLYGWRLDQITTKAGYKVVFKAGTGRADLPGSKQLDKIKIFYKNTLLKQFNLTYAEPIFTLSSVQELFDSLGVAKLPAYDFTYYTENPSTENYSRESESLDHWGYYNGAKNTTRFTAAMLDNTNNVYYAGADRQANLEACRWMTLKQIRYPTGGTVNYEYELNDFSNQPASLSYDHLSQLELIDSIEFTVTNTYHSLMPVTKSKTFTLSEDTPVVLFYEIPRLEDGGIPVSGLEASISKSSGSPFTTMEFIAGEEQVDSSPVHMFTPGTYTLYGEFFDDDIFAPGTQKFYVRIYRVKDIPTLVEAGELKGGGLRIRKIQSIGDNTYTKTYSYVSSATGKSSGKLFTFPYYSYSQEFDNKRMAVPEVDGFYGGCFLPDDGGMGTFLVRANAPTVSLGVSQGGYVGYSEVTEYAGDTTTNNGYTVYTFTNTPDVVNISYPFVPPQSFSYKNGLALTTKVYTAADKLVQENSNTYTYQNDSGITINGVKVAQAKSTACTGCENRTFTVQWYSEPTERVQLQSSASRVYDASADNYLETTGSFTYDAYDQVTEKAEALSNETERKKYTRYSYHTTFKTSPVKEYSYYSANNTNQLELIGGVSRDYLSPQKPTDIYLLETTPQVRTSGSPSTLGLYKHRLHIAYDTMSNATAVTRIGDPAVTSYIWDSGGIFPIAQVINTTPAHTAFTSFENSSSEGGWSFTLSQDTVAKTGTRSHKLNQSISKSGLTSAQTYILSYWTKGGDATVTGGTVNLGDSSTVGGWKYYEKTINGATTVTISGTGSTKIDELRLYPAAAQMTTYAYDIKNGLVSSTDVNNVTTYYSYTDRRHLEFVLDFEQNILKKNEYRYVRD